MGMLNCFSCNHQRHIWLEADQFPVGTLLIIYWPLQARHIHVYELSCAVSVFTSLELSPDGMLTHKRQKYLRWILYGAEDKCLIQKPTYTLEEKEKSREKTWIFEFLDFGRENFWTEIQVSQELNESTSEFIRKERKTNKSTCHDRWVVTYFYFQLGCNGNGWHNIDGPQVTVQSTQITCELKTVQVHP